MTAHKYGEHSYYQLDENKKLVFLECALCHRQSCFFTNTGTTHCLGCSKAPGVAGRDVAVELKAVESSLNRAIVEYLNIPATSADAVSPEPPRSADGEFSKGGGR